jgi:hypothetical protein
MRNVGIGHDHVILEKARFGDEFTLDWDLYYNNLELFGVLELVKYLADPRFSTFSSISSFSPPSCSQGPWATSYPNPHDNYFTSGGVTLSPRRR